MSNTTWTGSSSTDWATGANWSTGSVPTTGAHIVIPDTSSINNCVLDQTRTIGSLTIQANGTLVGGGFTLNVTSEGDASGGTEHYAVNIDGIISGDLNLNITTADSTNLDIIPSSGNIHDLTINLGDAARIAKIQTGGPTLTGDLTITSGQLSTENNALTVAGVVTNNGTLTLNGSTVNLGSTSAEAGDFQGSGTFNLDTSTINFHTASSANFTPDTSANFDTNTSTLNLIGLDSSTRAHNFTFASGNLHNVTTSRGTGSGTHIDKLNGNCTITGNLTVGANSKFSSGTRVFTVNGDVSVTGELDCDDSDKPMSFGSLTIASGGTYNATSGTTTITSEAGSGYAIEVSGTYTASAGTLKITTDANTFVKILDDVNHLIIEPATATRVYEYVNNTTIQGNLTINAGRFTHYSSTYSLDVQGDCTINNTGILDGGSGSIEMNSLTINSGGEYRATSGTTTTTGEAGSGYAWYNVSGTYTHNNGTVKFTGANDTDIREDAFYDVIILGNTSSVDFYIRQKDNESSSSGHIKIFNNLDIQRGGFSRAKPANELTVFGIVNISSLDSGTAYFGDTSDTGIYNLGAVNIHNGGTFNLSNGANNINSIRNISGTVTQD